MIVHDPTSKPVMVGDRLRQHGFELVELQLTSSVDDAHSDVAFPDPAEFDLIVPMGAIWSVYDEPTVGSWIGRELEMLRAADAAGVPVLGICFGFQALASAHGGVTKKAEVHQIGWFHVESSVPEAIAPGPWMEWHYDRSEPPADAEILASDESCVQAFRLRRNLGVQFHPEVDADHVEGWMNTGGYGEAEAHGVDGQQLLADTRRNVSLAKPNTYRLVDWFLAEVAGIETTLTEETAS